MPNYPSFRAVALLNVFEELFGDLGRWSPSALVAFDYAALCLVFRPGNHIPNHLSVGLKASLQQVGKLRYLCHRHHRLLGIEWKVRSRG
jgi:hypothetical protein